MKLIKSFLRYWLNGLLDHGWLFIIGHFFPIYIRQDCKFENDGYDIFSLRDNTHSYYYGLIINNPYYKPLKEY